MTAAVSMISLASVKHSFGEEHHRLRFHHHYHASLLLHARSVRRHGKASGKINVLSMSIVSQLSVTVIALKMVCILDLARLFNSSHLLKILRALHGSTNGNHLFFWSDFAQSYQLTPSAIKQKHAGQNSNRQWKRQLPLNCQKLFARIFFIPTHWSWSGWNIFH